ncbi:MAG: hypothetical protein EXS35_13555 [Pedosphaera sp.]|nr:hypothetical protein [Pedosphaera sp.]
MDPAARHGSAVPGEHRGGRADVVVAGDGGPALRNPERDQRDEYPHVTRCGDADKLARLVVRDEYFGGGADLSRAERTVSLRDATFLWFIGPSERRNMMQRFLKLAVVLAIGFATASLYAASGETNRIVWNKAKGRVDADVRGLELLPLLERVEKETGWQIFVEPNSKHEASAKFKNVPAGEALRLLLGDLNFALVPRTNAASRLYVFSTAANKATQAVKAAPKSAVPKRVPNELIVRVKPGTDIAALARSLGAKVTGKLGGADIYRLEFPDEAAANAAKDQLAGNSDVTGTDYNYYFDQPKPLDGFAGSGAGTRPISLQLNPPGDSGRILIGLVDTAVQSMGANLDKFVAKQISVAGDAVLNPCEPSHGTAMAETMMRSLESVTKGSTSAQILAVDVYGPNASTTTWNVAQGIVSAVNNGANVINLSLGGPADSPMLKDLIGAVIAKGIPVFAAAGNEPVATPFYPAAYPGVVAVTGVEQGKIAPYANFGSFVDVGAPDTSTVFLCNRAWMVQGTSASAAYVSGMAAGMADTTHQTWAQVQQSILKLMAVPGAK